jgi:pimeloyl-ACP methyl ester carboxylesterase
MTPDGRKSEMKLVPLVIAALGLAAAAAIALHQAVGGAPVADSASARCNTPTARFGPTVVQAEYREAQVHFTCAGATIAGTLTLPPGGGPHPAVVFVHGSGKAGRYTWRAPFVQAFVRGGIAVLSYDKRGVGESGGTCCPGDYGHFNLLAADADGAVSALRARADVERDRIGLIGASQAGWVVPLATVRSRGHVAFTALVDGPAVSGGEERRWSELAGEEDADAPTLTAQRRHELERKLGGPSGFDPRPYLARMTTPGLWLYGGRDRSVPTARSAATLRDLRGKHFEVVVYPRAGHGLLDTPPSDQRALPTLVAWVQLVTG